MIWLKVAERWEKGLAEILQRIQSGQPSGGDTSSNDNGEDDWMRRNHLGKYKVESSADPAATPSPAALAVPLATAAATVAAAQAAPGGGLSGFKVPSPQGAGGRGSGVSGRGDSKGNDPDPDWTAHGVHGGSNDGGGLRTMLAGHYAELAKMGMAPIGDDSGGPIDPNGRRPAAGFTQSGGYYYASEHGGKSWAQAFAGIGDASQDNGGNGKDWQDSFGVEHSAKGAIGPGGAQPWQAPPRMSPGSDKGSTTASVSSPAGGSGGNAGNTAQMGAAILAKLESLLTALTAEGTFLQKVLS